MYNFIYFILYILFVVLAEACLHAPASDVLVGSLEVGFLCLSESQSKGKSPADRFVIVVLLF